MNEKLDYTWDDNPVDVTQESNFIWSIANKLRGDFKEDQYGDVIIPMTVLRRFECTLKDTKKKVVETYKKNPKTPAQALCKASSFNFYNTSEFDLTELLNDQDHLASNLKAYVNGFSDNALLIFSELEFDTQIRKMDKGGCLYTVVKAFSELELSPDKVDSIKMGYIFENLIGRFFQNESQGQYYTGRDIIKCMMSILISEGCDDIFESGKEITVLDQAAGTGGMLSTAYSYLKHYNPNCNVRLFGQEYNPISHAVGLAEMLIKGQDAKNFRQADTFKTDCFDDVQMRFLLENPPFGTSWGGKDAKDGQEDAVRKEFAKGLKGRWGAGLPGTGDGQLLFMQSAINKLASNGRAAIISNGAPLFNGTTSSGESQIRRWMIETDLVEAIIALPEDLFYNTGIPTYVWILSKSKSKHRINKIQLINASNTFHLLRKSAGNKRVEITPEDRETITKLYTEFRENEFCKIYDKEDFLYREYTVMQPLQRSYAINEERIENMLSKGSLSSLYDEAKVYELENSQEELKEKEQKKLDDFYKKKSIYDNVLGILNNNISDKVYLSKDEFMPYIEGLLVGSVDKKLIGKIVDGLSLMDKNAEIQKDKKGIIYDKETKDIEIVPFSQKIDDYMEKKIYPYSPNAKATFEAKDEYATFEMDQGEKSIKIGAEIPFVKCFYRPEIFKNSDDILSELLTMEDKLSNNTFNKISNNIANVKDSEYSWLGLIPEDWNVERVKDGFNRKKAKANQENPVVLSLARSGIKIRDISTNEGQLASSYYEYNPVEPGDMMLNPMDLQSGANCSLSKVSGVISPAYVNLKHKDEYNPEYYDYYFKYQYWSRAFFAHGKGVSYENRWTLNDDILMRFPLLKPSYEEQTKIAEYLNKECNAIDEITNELQFKIELLEKYKRSLIFEMVTGKKKIK